MQTLELQETVSSPAPTISKQFDHGRPVVFAGEDYENDSEREIIRKRGESDVRIKGGTWLSA